MAGYYSVWKSISCLLSISTLIHIGVADTTPSSVIDNYGACSGVWGQQLEVRAQPGQEQFIESPGFPFDYPNSTNCKWRISTNLTGYVIKLETVFIELENRYDFLRVFDGNSTLSPTLLQISTRSVARNLTTYSSGPSVYVTFTTDAWTSYQGFRLRFMAVLNSTSDLSLACNSPFMPPALDAYPNVVQNIRSMNYPSNYSNNANCYWLIEADYGYVIQLDVREMDLEIVDSCNFDYLEFFDGNGIYSPILTKLCNSSLQYVYSTGQIMYLHFRSDESVVGKGFFLQYTAVPGTNMPSTTTTSSVNATMNTSGVADTTPSSVIDNYGACSGVWGQQLEVRAQPGQEQFIESPDFPFDYPNSTDCKWRISTNLTGYVIKLETVFFELENRYDVFQVFDGNSQLSPTLLQISTRSVARNLTTYSSGPSVYVTFTTDASTSYQGFRLRFMAVLNSTSDLSLACNPSFRPVTLAAYPNVVQNIRSIGYPSNYSNNANCYWLIEADYGYVIQLDVREMDLEIGDSCNFDYLEFFDGDGSYSPMLTKLCNSSLQYVNSTGQRMLLYFRSDGSVVRKGFFLQYTAVPETDVPRTTTTSSVNTTTNTSASSKACNYWNRPLYLYISPGNTNFIESPNYPNNYPNGASCGWVISTYYSGYVVELRTEYVNLESSDVITVYKGYYDMTLLRSFSTMQDTPVQSTEQSMYVTFTSDSTVTYSGFRLSYTAVLRNGPTFTTTTSTTLQACNLGSRPLYLSIFAGETNFIQSPNYPNVYPNDADCGWIISTYSSDYVVELSTDYVDLENRYDVIKVYDGSSIYGGVLLRNITSVQDTPVQSTGRSMYVTFTSDFSITKTGFRLRYTAVLRNGPSFTTTSSSLQACSLGSRPLYLSIFAGETNIIQSPNYPNAYPNNADCGWIISTYSSDYIVELSTDYVDLENRYDVIKVYDGSWVSDGILLRSISSNQSTPVQSTGQWMYVTFTSDGTTTKTGFRLSYRALLRNGPSFTTTSSASLQACSLGSRPLYLSIFAGETNFIQSPNYPNAYPNGAECGWIISTYSSDYIVELSTDYVDLENTYDLLNVYDGSWISDSGLLRSISSVQSTPVQSTGQWMYVTFTSDGSTTKTGFSLSYRAVLRNGPSFATTSSPSYHAAYESTSSLWLILGVVLGAIGIIALIISIIVVVKCRRRPRVPTARLCIPPAHMAGGYNNVFAQPGSQAMQLSNGIYVVPTPDPRMPTAIYASAPPAYDNIAFTACFNEPSRDIPQQPLENPMCSVHPETGDVPPEYSKIQHSDAACVA